MIHCALRTQIPDEFRVTRNYWSLWKAFVIVFFQRFRIRSNCLGSPFEKICHWKRNALRPKDPGNLFEKNCHAFERLALFVGKNCHPPFQLLGLSVQRIVIRINGSNYPFQNIVCRYTVPNHFHPILGDPGAVRVWSGEVASEVQGRKQAPGYRLSPDHFQTVKRMLAPKTFVAFSPDPTDCH